MDGAGFSTVHDKMTTKLYVEEMIASFRKQMHDAETLADELNDVLANYAAILNDNKNPKAPYDAEGLGYWLLSYSDELDAAERILLNGDMLINGLGAHLPAKTGDKGGGRIERALKNVENEGGPIDQDPIDKSPGGRKNDLTSAA